MDLYISDYIISSNCRYWNGFKGEISVEYNYDEIQSDILTIILLIVIVIFFTSKINKNIRKLITSIQKARTGDLGSLSKGTSKDEMGVLSQYFDETLEDLGKLVRNIQNVLGHLTTSSQSLAATSELNQYTEDMVKLAQKTGEAYDEGVSSVDGVNEDKEQIVNSIENISAVLEETAAASEEVTASMDQQIFAVEEVAKTAQNLNQISIELNQEISKFKI